MRKTIGKIGVFAALMAMFDKSLNQETRELAHIEPPYEGTRPSSFQMRKQRFSGVIKAQRAAQKRRNKTNSRRP